MGAKQGQIIKAVKWSVKDTDLPYTPDSEDLHQSNKRHGNQSNQS